MRVIIDFVSIVLHQAGPDLAVLNVIEDILIQSRLLFLNQHQHFQPKAYPNRQSKTKYLDGNIVEFYGHLPSFRWASATRQPQE